MSSCTGSEGWERWKNIIHDLYIVQNGNLQGPYGVIKLMEDRHGFKATKGQYENRFKAWGFRKNRKRADYQIISQKIDKRKRAGKESNIYKDEQLMDVKRLRKEISRQGHMSYMELLDSAKASSPRTPPGFEIRTPSDQSFVHKIHMELPILQIQEILRNFAESFNLFDPDLVLTVLPLGPGESKAKSMSSVMKSLFPTSTLTQESLTSDLAINETDQLGSIETLNLMLYLISNNFPAQSSGKEIYEWLKTHEKLTSSVLRLMKGPSAEALFEKLFRLAVEAEDIPLVRNLIQAGVDTNGSSCMLKYCPDPLTPLQFACFRGNTELAQELIKAGSRVDESRCGWKTSAIVLAIHGHRGLSCMTQMNEGFDHANDGERCGDHLFDLVNCLINAGARVNVESSSKLEGYGGPNYFTYSSVCEGQSPLTIAARYADQRLVDLLLQHGADVRLRNKNGNSALRECLYQHIRRSNSGYFQTCDTRKRVSPEFRLSDSNAESVIGVVRILIDAGVDLNDRVPCDKTRSDRVPCDKTRSDNLFMRYSPLDIAVFTKCIELVELMLCAGAEGTQLSLEVALEVRSFKIFDFLLKAGAPIPTWAMSEKDELVCPPSPTSVGLASRKRAAIIGAICLGATAALDDLIRSVDGHFTSLFDGCRALTEAIEHCCFSGGLDVLRLLLEENIIGRSALVPLPNHSIYSAIFHDRVDSVDMLLKAGADVNRSWSNDTPILLAIKRRNSELVRELINAGASLNEEHDCGGTHKRLGDVLVAAIAYGPDAMVEDFILAGANIDAPGTLPDPDWAPWPKCSCCSPLTAAILKKRWTLVDWLLDAGAAVNNAPGMSWCRTPLWAAVRTVHNVNIVLVRRLLEAGAAADDLAALQKVTNNIELLQLFLAELAIGSNWENLKPMIRRTLEEAMSDLGPKGQAVVRLVLESGLANVNDLGILDGYSNPLHQVSKRLPRLSTVPNTPEFIDEIDAISHPALRTAVRGQDFERVRFLLEAGVMVNPMSEASRIPSPERDLNLQNPWVRSRLDITALTVVGLAAEKSDLKIVKILLDHNADPNERAESHTALQIAAREGCTEIAELLLEHGADVNAPPAKKYGATALQFAAIGGYLGMAHLLLEKGADVNARPAEIGGRTALEGAAEHGRIDMVQLLVNAGADISEKGEGQYERAVMRASEKGHNALRRLLESYLV